MYKPNTEGWRNLSNRRMEQAYFVESVNDKLDLWYVSVVSAFVQPNFTDTGWGLTRAPEDLLELLQDTIRTAYDEGDYRVEDEDMVNGLKPLFIDRPDLTDYVLESLQSMHEAWAGIPLVQQQAYGFRLYRNESSLLMHVDRHQTHVISSIFHIDSSDDSEPWPIIIEDYLGNTNEVILTPGDMLFYESSKCFHGRPTKFNGSWYSSLFIHYYPDIPDWVDLDWDREISTLIPPGWNDAPGWETHLPPLLVNSGAIREPTCLNDWCNLIDAIPWKGPAEMDFVITSGSRKLPLWDANDAEL
jgi:hypothetical protein